MKLVRGTIPGLEGERDIAVLEGDTHIGHWIETSGRLDHDQNTLPKLAKFIDRESVIYDLGALYGDHTAFYASLKPRAVVAFEPYRDAFECLCHNLSGIQGVAMCNVAVGNGEVIQTSGDAPNKGSRYVIRAPDGGIEVSRRIDDMVGYFLPPTFMKIDVEGWEVKVLAGAERTLKRCHPVIVCEVNRGALERAGNTPEELHALLHGLGYDLTELQKGKPWEPNDPRPMFDAVAVPR